MGTPRRGLGYNPLGKERENSDIKKGDLEPPDLMATGPLSVSVRKGITTIIQEVFTLKESLIPNTRAEIKLGIERLYEVIAKMVPEVNKVHFTDESIWKKIKQEHKEGNQNSVREPQRKEDTIRNGLKKISEGDFGLICDLLDTEWPESVFERTKINYQFPLAGGKRGNLALLFSQKKEANTAIRNLAEKAFGEIDDLIQDGLVKDGFQKIETMSKKGNQEPTTSYGFLISADCDGENFQRLRKEMIDEEIKTIGITTVSSTDPIKLRKMTEIEFYGTDKEVTIFCQPKPNERAKINATKVRDYETVRICTSLTGDQSYAEMAGKIKENLNPSVLGVEIKGTRKSGKNEILIRTEKGGAEKVRQQMTENFNQEANCPLKVETVSQKRPILINKIEILATEEDLTEAIRRELSDTKVEIVVKKFYETKFGDRNAEVWLEDDFARRLEDKGKIKVNWCISSVKRKTKIDRCTICLRIGHKSSKCNAPKKKRKLLCLKCCKEGHSFRDCEGKEFCNECNTEGHSPVTTKCPVFRRLVSRLSKS
jgi:Arginine methyltransferase-interacting protein, contains RING Zn-finger